MSAGHNGSDLGRILHDEKWASPSCVICPWQYTETNKPAAIRLSRAHARSTGHVVVIWISHYQHVYPPKVTS